MIETSLVEKPVNEEDFIFLQSDLFPMLFLGYVVRNEYDNRRLYFNPHYDPLKFFHVVNSDKQDAVQVVPFFGIKLQPNEDIKNLITTLQTQKKEGQINLNTYKNILDQYGLKCENNYSYLSEGCYPIDFINLKSVCNDSIKNDKRIMQHILSIDDKQFDFQAFAALKLFILIQ